MRSIVDLVLVVTLGAALSDPALGQLPAKANRNEAPAARPARAGGGVAGGGGQLVAPARPPGSAPAIKPLDPAAQAKIDSILREWEQASTSTNTLYAEFEQVDKLMIVGKEDVYQGKAYLQRPNLALLNLEKEDKQKKAFVFDRRIVSTGKEVLEYNAVAKQVTVFPLPEDARQRALEEGPLPFLFNMKVESFKRRYHAYLQQETAKSYRIIIQPLQAIDRDAFHTAVLDLNKQTLLPDAIYTLSANGKDQQIYKIKQIRKNGEFGGALFAWDNDKRTEVTRKGWRIIVNPGPGESEMEIEPISPGAAAAPAAGRSASASPGRPR